MKRLILYNQAPPSSPSTLSTDSSPTRPLILDQPLELNDLIQSHIWHEPCLSPGVMAQKFQMEIAAMPHTQSLSLLPRNGRSGPFVELRQSLPSKVAVISPFRSKKAARL